MSAPMTPQERQKRMLAEQRARLQQRGAGMMAPAVTATSMPRPSTPSQSISFSSAGPSTPLQPTSSMLNFYEAPGSPEQVETMTIPESPVVKSLRAKNIAMDFDPTRKRAPIIEPGPSMTIDQIRLFVRQPAPKSQTVQMQIVRDRSGMKKFFPEYRLTFKDGQFALAARKRKKSKTTNYLISLDQEDRGRSSTGFVGKLRGNFLGTQFVMYDDGEAPEKAAKKPQTSTGPDGAPISGLRCELGLCTYEPNILGTKGPRKMHVAIPAMTDDDEPMTIQPKDENETLEARIRLNKKDDLVILQNKQPQWNEESHSYVLNFKGRVSVASVKNFQLIHPDNMDYVVLQFGKQGPDVFTMDFQYPLTALQAFLICLSSFDNKLACE